MTSGKTSFNLEAGDRPEQDYKRPFLSVIIPAYNEEKRIGLSLRKILDYLQARRFEAEIIVVDDGSSDQTATLAGEILSDFPDSKIISLPDNKGKGAAVREGVLNSKGNLILFTDADLSTPIEELNKLLPLIGENYEVVIGSRALPGSEIKKRQGWLREHLGKFFNLLVRLLVLKGFKDTQCGFKLFKREPAQKIFSRLKTRGFAFDVEALLLAQKLGYQIAQVPIVWINYPESRVHLIRSSFRMFLELLRIKRRKKESFNSRADF
ncbi:MAG: dolichyl-phosphate beta-glucosyltransferase [Candidatus Saccharicenans sp.]